VDLLTIRLGWVLTLRSCSFTVMLVILTLVSIS